MDVPKVRLSNKVYHFDFISQDLEGRGGVAMISAKRNRLIRLPDDAALYPLRSLVERSYNLKKCPAPRNPGSQDR